MNLFKTVIVTGATSGIGLETARTIAGKGHRVIMACRNVERATALAKKFVLEMENPEIYPRFLDLASIESIEAFSREFQASFDRLDVLINNAGVFCDHQARTREGFEMTMGVNFLGPLLLTRLLFPSLIATPGARIINVSSRAGLLARIKPGPRIFSDKIYGFKAYSRSKLAQLFFTIDLARELQEQGVTVNALAPGRAATGIWRGQSLLMKIIRPLMLRTSISPQKGAETGIYLALSPEIEDISGKLFENKKELKMNKTLADANLRRELMQLSYAALKPHSSIDFPQI